MATCLPLTYFLFFYLPMIKPRALPQSYSLPNYPGTHSVDQAGLKLRNPPASASHVLGGGQSLTLLPVLVLNGICSPGKALNFGSSSPVS